MYAGIFIILYLLYESDISDIVVKYSYINANIYIYT